MSAPLELSFTPGEAIAFIDLLWRELPAPPQGVLVGALHLSGDRGQILISVSDPAVRELVVLPGQMLIVLDPADAGTWRVTDNPATAHLRLQR